MASSRNSIFLSGTMRQQVPIARFGSTWRGRRASAGGSGRKLGGGVTAFGIVCSFERSLHRDVGGLPPEYLATNPSSRSKYCRAVSEILCWKAADASNSSNNIG